jgi:thioester reductase-like protein
MTSAAAATAPTSGVLASLQTLAAECLRLSVADVEPDVSLTLLGLDSLGAVELGAAIESRFGIDIGPEALADGHTLRTLADEIARHRESKTSAQSGSRAEAAFQQMLEDAVLPSDVVPSRAGGRTCDLTAARTVLLTGATGFVGAFLLRELIRQTRATIVCLVRPGRTEPAVRLQNHLGALGIDVPSKRVCVVSGDLERSRLGMDDARLAALGAQVDAVCHAAASVNWVYPYSALRGVNVAATRELLRFATPRGLPFHFVSSLGVCYATPGPSRVDERFEPLAYVRNLPFGYAQSKCVAEALVLEAGRRGLPVRIYRPGLISGDSARGAFNADDLVTALITGCIRMGTAPDLDWQLDAVPVDTVAAALVRLSSSSGTIFHLAHPHPRHWRECVLWIRQYGYPIRLVPYHAWLRQLESDTAVCADHPLRALRAFFSGRPDCGGGLTLPELYEESRRTRADSTRSFAEVSKRGVAFPQLDSALLERYFTAFTSAGRLSPPPRVNGLTRATVDAAPLDRPLDPAYFTELLATRSPHLRVSAATLDGAGSDDSIVSELTSWQSRRRAGLFRFRLDCVGDVVLKLKPPASHVQDVGETLAAVCDPDLGNAFARWRNRLGFVRCDVRELAVYCQDDPRFRRHAPELFGGREEIGGGCALLLERVHPAATLDVGADVRRLSDAEMTATLRGMACLHAIWFERHDELGAKSWLGFARTAQAVGEMTDLWTALADHASGAFAAWTEPGIVNVQRRLVEAAADWWRALDEAPRTLIHNDFNPRNVCLRTLEGELRLCAYDWELATAGAPQRDLAEWLCFVLSPAATRSEVAGWIELYRLALQRETGVPLDARAWTAGFRAALYDLMLDRLPGYALVDRVKRQRFLPGVVRTWLALYRMFPLEAHS